MFLLPERFELHAYFCMMLNGARWFGLFCPWVGHSIQAECYCRYCYQSCNLHKSHAEHIFVELVMELSSTWSLTNSVDTRNDFFEVLLCEAFHCDLRYNMSNYCDLWSCMSYPSQFMTPWAKHIKRAIIVELFELFCMRLLMDKDGTIWLSFSFYSCKM